MGHYFDYMNILICPDKFKDSLTAQQVCEALEIGIKRRRPKSVIQLMPLADGGEGTLEVIKTIHGGEWVQKKVNDPLFRPIEANYLWLADQKIAYIEMSRASGIELLKIKERNPYLTSTFGTGELILDAIEKGATEIVLTIGGSATNDAGIGMAAALGFKFLNILKTIITENSSDGDANVEFTFRDIKPWIKYPMNRIYFNNLSLKSGRFGSDTENIALISNDGEVYKFDIDDFNYNRLKRNAYVEGSVFKQIYPQEMDSLLDLVDQQKPTSTGNFDVSYLKKNESGVPKTILDTLKEIYPNNWGRINQPDCETLDGVIDIFPAVPGERWSILNFFDTNPGVIKILIEEYKKENRNESTDDFKSWIKENGEKLFGESSDILKKLIKTNIRSFDSGSKTEDTFMRLVKQKFGLEDKDVVRYCLGSIKDRVDSIDFSIKGKTFQVKPADKTFKTDNGIGVYTFGMKKSYMYKRNLDYIVYVNNKLDSFIIFPNSNYSVDKTGRETIHKSSPVKNPFD